MKIARGAAFAEERGQSLRAGLNSMANVSRHVVVSNKLGLHARPAMEFVHAANRFSSAVKVRKHGDDPMVVDGKSIMEMMTLAAVEGTPLEILADGEDATAAVDALIGLFESRFGEEA
jgi:phosphocarrier protein